MSRFTGLGRGLSLAALAAAVVFLAGCGSSSATPSKANADAQRFPIGILAANGTVRLAKRPTRIVSLSPSATQDLYAVGAGRQVVAVDSNSTFPKQAPHTKLSAYTPNVEAVSKYRPDLVVIANEQGNDIVAQLGKLQIPVLVEPAAANLKNVYGEIAQIGRATGHTLGAERVVARMKRQIGEIIRTTPHPNSPLSVYHELDQTYYSANSHTFIGRMYSLLGLRDIADKAQSTTDYPQLSAEYIIAADPDLIVLADSVCCNQTRATVAARPGWNTIKAVKTGMVVPVNDSIASQWGPRVVVFLKTVASAVKRLEARK